MRASPTASTLLPTLFWSMSLLSLFAAPVLMAARDGGGDTEVHGTDGHTAELIRRHREVVSPFFSVPETQPRPTDSLGGRQLRNGPAMTEEITEEWSFVREARPEIEAIIRPVGNRAKRIRV